MTPLKMPAPQGSTAACDKTWLPQIQKCLPYSWVVDANLVREKAVKRDDAGVPTQVWDKQCALVFPRASSARLDLLRKLILWVAVVSHMFSEFLDYLTEIYGQDWLAQLQGGQKRAALRHSM
jgi:hypothetical protein